MNTPSRSRISFLFSAAFWVLTLAVSAHPQNEKPALSGRVLDQNSAAIKGATVTLEQSSRLINTAITDETGFFKISEIPPGKYQIRVAQENFLPADLIIVLRPGENLSRDLVLFPGTIAESVVITSSHLVANLESVERIPGSVEIVDAKTIETSRAFTSTEVLRKVTGVNTRDEEGFGLRPNIGIRGLNPTRSTKVLLLEDGIPLTYAPYGDNGSYYHPPIDRFESVEVLKGSGQILYGPQTIGGVINYITRTPPSLRSGSILLMGGNRSYFNGHLNFGDTIGNTGLLFEYTRKQGQGARENVRSGLNDFNFKSISSLTSRQALTARFNYYSEDSNVTYSGLREDEFGANPRGNPFRNDFFYGDRLGASLTHAYIFSPEVVLTTNLYSSYFRRHWWRQSSNSNERPNDSSDPVCGGMANLNTTCGNQGRLRRYVFAGIEPRLHVETRLFGNRNEADFGFRAHFEDQERRQKNGDRPFSRDGLLVENNQRRNQAYSGFAQNRFIFGDLIITPGLRIEHIKFERTNRLLNVAGKTSLTEVVPGLGVSYTPGGNFTLFAGVHRGFAPPRTEDIINNTTGGSVDLDPELSWNYEMGLRHRFHRGIGVEATFFRLDYLNQIVPASLAGGIGSTFTNGGKTLHQGVEISGQFDAASTFNWLHNIYFRGAYTFLPTAEFRGNRFSSVPGFTTTRVTGNRLPYAPEHLFNGSIGYSNRSGFDGFIEAVYASSQFGEDLNLRAPISTNGQTGPIPSYLIWNVTANYNVEKLHTAFFVTAKNLFDRLYIADRARGITPGPPRLIQAGVKFNF
ncbi:MAG TPA: TonB-dependent receptor [Pyrinomonadaceae bacterium]|nr:TonB-dependent receptor [Pyrinomonadaceae bacterium]